MDVNMDFEDPSVLKSDIFDYLIIPSTVHGDHVRFGIQSYSCHPRFKKCLFRTRRPIEEFKDFCEFMVSRHPNITVPPLPFEEALPDEDRASLNNKVAELRRFCEQLLQIPEVFNDHCLPLFYQSHLSMEEIREKIAKQEAEVVSNLSDQPVEANNGNNQQAEENKDQQVEANNDHQQVVENKDGGHSSDAEFSASVNETDEPIFHMEDI